jgi:hypothetical protein
MLRSLVNRILGSRRAHLNRRLPGHSEHPEILELKLGEPRDWVGNFLDVPLPEVKLSPQMFAARWICGDIYGEDTQAIAADLLEAGYDSPSLRQLAGAIQIQSRADAADLMKRIIREFNLPVQFPVDQACLIVSRQIARTVIAGRRDPWRGCADIELIWSGHAEHRIVKAILAAADDLVWDSERQTYRPVVDSDLLKSFAELGKLTDSDIFGTQ